MIARGLRLTGAALPLLLLGCVVEQRDFEALKEQVRVQQRQINELKARQEEQGLRIDTLNNGFKILGDKAEENGRRIDGLEERGGVSGGASIAVPEPSPSAAAPAAPEAAAPTVQPLPAAVAAPAASPAAAPAAATPPPVLLTNLPKTPAPASGGELISSSSKAEKLYATALGLFSNRDYTPAAAKFEEFVTDYRDHKLAGNAQYWIGECQYSQRHFAEAADEFGKVEKLFPASPKVAAALYKKGLSLWELKRTADAQAALQRLIEKYPQSEEAGKARERLERWK
ncbi:MAG TPA: tol-pal system protein YbgF [bacterium]